MNPIEYCAEEVRRQGHDITEADGIERVGWMLNAWTLALDQRGGPISVDLVRKLGIAVEPKKNKMGFRRCGVRVGRSVPPSADQIKPLLEAWIARIPEMNPMEAYRSFEEIHPFVDGNGRTGKVILNALNGTLLDPIFPPNDFWGHWIQNP